MSLSLQHVAFRFAGRPILSDFSFDMAPGEHSLLIGASGSGKSTLVNLVCGLLTPDSGSISIGGESMTGQSTSKRDDLRRRRIGLVFQTLRLVSALDITGNLLLAQRLVGGTGGTERVAMLIDRLGLSHRTHALPRQLSQGEAQRAAIARALIGQPDLIIADEPTSALDHANMEKVITLLRDCAREAGSSLLIVTHDDRLRAHIESVRAIGAMTPQAAA
ncbi:ABC transporter ATP-binding protein [Blastomonas sp.]|uniref:ABC transporter ATP-binding protein n=1 Tax=Blastomonas sp. TaxID=1909299 RepID=UPI0026103570|nr:ATP-binding cassette domain-containing protein [Blastomonas sp.]MDM7956632.1 ATP-binding cassette domain-containing protein [Blastomonas sp.]